MSKNYSTPGLYREETDISEITVAEGTSTGAIVIDSKKGPINRRILVTDDKDFIEKFGEPDGSKFGHYAALEFLSESNQLYVVRASGGVNELYSNFCVGESEVTSASSTSAAILSAGSSTDSITGVYSDGDKSNDIKTIENIIFPGDTFLCISSNGPGEYGNNIGIRLTTCADTPAVSGGNFDWKNKYDDNPLTAVDPLFAKVFKIEVFVKESTATEFSSVATPLETFYVTRTEEVDGNGRQLQIEKIINGKSKYIYVKNDNTQSSGSLPISLGQTTIKLLTSGTYSSSAISQGNMQSAYSLYEDRNKSKINILMFIDEPTDTIVQTTQSYVGNLAASRQDCIAVVQSNPLTYEEISDIINNTNFSYIVGSYVALYAGYSRIYDKYNDKYIYIPNAIFGASLMARTDSVANTWDAPAGINRGIVNANDQDRIFSDTEIGLLYDANINCIKKINGIGYVMWGQKTAQLKESARDRINVRRLLLVVENTVEPSLFPFLFESNTEQNRLRATTIVQDYLGTVQSGKGIIKYLVICDETNNIAEVIDANLMLMDIYVQPAKTTEFIKVQTIVTKTGVDFTEA